LIFVFSCKTKAITPQTAPYVTPVIYTYKMSCIKNIVMVGIPTRKTYSRENCSGIFVPNSFFFRCPYPQNDGRYCQSYSSYHMASRILYKTQ